MNEHPCARHGMPEARLTAILGSAELGSTTSRLTQPMDGAVALSHIRVCSVVVIHPRRAAERSLRSARGAARLGAAPWVGCLERSETKPLWRLGGVSGPVTAKIKWAARISRGVPKIRGRLPADAIWAARNLRVFTRTSATREVATLYIIKQAGS